MIVRPVSSGAWALGLVAVAASACGGGPCSAPPEVSSLELAAARDKYPKLADWCLVDPPVTAGSGTVALHERVEPYALSTPLFSDGALKQRTVWLPPGATATYRDPEVLDFPVGTLITKTFSFAADLRAPTTGIKLVETRILARTGAGWLAIPYTWDAADHEASINLSGDVVPQHYLDENGDARDAMYLIPGATQCGQCHHDEGTERTAPIGPKVRNLNRDYPYAGGSENQLSHLARVGYVTGAPTDLPKLATASDPASGTIEARARAWLESNCAHCHSESGLGSNTALTLWARETSSDKIGICKRPVAAGPASGGRTYDVVPGKPDESILVFRIESVDPSLMMPPIGRSLVDKQGVALVRQWIAEMPGDCP